MQRIYKNRLAFRYITPIMTINLETPLTLQVYPMADDWERIAAIVRQWERHTILMSCGFND